jgi:hypothetical protein
MTATCNTQAGAPETGDDRASPGRASAILTGADDTHHTAG